jgi:hypothetical protein
MTNFNARTKVVLLLLVLTVFGSGRGQTTTGVGAQVSPDDCSWQPTTGGDAAKGPPRGNSRKALKLRTAGEGKNYTKYNRGKPITLDQWFKFTCGLDALVPKDIPADKPIEGAETVRVTLRGYLLGTKFMRGGDHDIHVELGASPDWDSDHVVVEMSPGTEYCPARKALWKLAKKDGCKEDQCILEKPVEILVTGYVLIGNPQPGVTDYCNVVVNRGLKKGEKQGRVRGLWRLQPVLSVKKV